MRLDGTIAMFQYWDSLRAGRSAPSRAEIDPTAIRRRLPDIFILEMGEDGTARFRLAGTQVCAMFGRELRHDAFDGLWHGAARQELAALVDATMNDHSAVVADVLARGLETRSLRAELLLLPLEAGLGRPRAIGALTVDERPYWMGVSPLRELDLLGARTIVAGAQAQMFDNAHVPALAPALNELTQMQSARRVRHLVVHEGGRSH